SCWMAYLFELTRRRPTTTLLPYTTLFRSGHIRPEDAARHRGEGALSGHGPLRGPAISITGTSTRRRQFGICALRAHGSGRAGDRSEEHTSELQSRENLVCRLLLEKKKKYT